MAIDKSGWNTKVKVSQSTIDDIKKMGMAKALKLASQNSKASQAGLVKEYQEATRRLYGEKRFAAATGAKNTIGATGSSGSKSGSKKPAAAVKSPTGDYSSRSKTQTAPKTTAYTKGKSGMVNSKSDYKQTSSKKSGFHITPKEVLGTAAAVGLMVASRGRATGAAARLAPGVTKLLANKSYVAPKVLQVTSKAGSKVSSAAVKAGEKVSAATGRVAAKTGKAVSQTQYEAMQAAAKAKGIKAPTVDAAKAAAGKVTKPAAKITVKKTGAAAGASTVVRSGKKK